MDIYDEINRIQALQKQLDPLTRLTGSYSRNAIEEAYKRDLALSQSREPALAYLTDLDKYKQQIEEANRWTLATLGIQSAADRALAMVEQSKISHYIEQLHSAQAARENFDVYQRATAWLDPLRALVPTQDWLAELRKFHSLTSVADPLGLYRQMTEKLYESSTWGVTQQVRDMLDALEAVGRDIHGDMDEVERVEPQIDENDVVRVSGLVHASSSTVSLSAESIGQLVHEWMSAYQQLSSLQDKKIFATYIYPLILALVFSMINPYSDFIVKQKLESANKTSEKSLKSAARDRGLPSYVIDNFRFVSAKQLDVRANKKKRSPKIGVFKFGQPVEILKKDGDWTLVHYSDAESDAAIQGWVFSRYLKRYR
jgi:hypothetical protein